MNFSNLQLPTTIPSIIISNNSIIPKKADHFLHVVLDERMQFDDHISFLCRKVSKIYRNLVWGNTFSTHLNLDVCRKKPITIINKADCNAHTEKLFFKTKIFRLIDINLYFQKLICTSLIKQISKFSYS